MQLLKLIFRSLLSLMIMIPSVEAQVLGGFFNQKGTQRKYMIQQIALYATYLRYAKKGYDISRSGLQTIGNIRKGELDLHTAYYNSLSNVNPTVKDQRAVRETIRYYDDIEKLINEMTHFCSSSKWLSTGDKQYVTQVSTLLARDNSRILEELSVSVTPGALKMTDDERLRKVGACLTDIRSLYGAASSFARSIRQLVAGRETDHTEVEHISILYDLH